MSGLSTGHHHPGQHHTPGRYEIRLDGHLDSRWSAWFDGLSLTTESDGTTTIHGPVVDQAALYGVLRKLSDLGLTLISVTKVDPDPSDAPGMGPSQPTTARRRE